VKTLRTIIWVLAALAFVVFAAYNWQPVELTLWQNLVLETKVPVLALLAFAAGFLPMWAVHRSVTWGQNRRIRTLENSLKNTALAHRAVPSPVMPDSPVDKSGKTGGDSGDPFSPADRGGDAGGSE
jgi:uncharacterized integral membrane protein